MVLLGEGVGPRKKMQLEIHGFETLLIVQRISYKQCARCKVEVQEPPLGWFYPILGYGCSGCQNLYHLQVQCQDPGMMLDPETDLQLGPDLGSRWLCAQGEWPIPEQGLKPEPVANPVTSQGYYSVLLYKWLNWSGRRPNSLQCEGSNQCSVQLQSR